MAEEIVKIIKIETEGSEQTVKGLKKEIQDLRDNILNLEKGTEEYDKAVEQLQTDQRELDEVMGLTKKTATALDGSYDALTFKMAQLKKEWRATNDEGKRNELGKQINAINDELKAMDATTGNFQRNVGDYTNSIEDAFGNLRKEIKQLKGQLLTLDEGSQEYADTMAELADKTFSLRDMQEKAKYSTADFGEQLANVTGIAAGMTAGFQAVQSVLILAGGESEEFEKVMIKVQATMALVTGLQGMEGLIDRIGGLKVALKASCAGLSGFKKALIGTGIGAIVVLVGTLVANWEDLVTWIDKSVVSLDKFKKIFAGVANAVSNYFSNLFKSIGKALTGHFKEAGDMLKNAFDFAGAYAEGFHNKEVQMAEDAAMKKAEASFKETESYIKDQEAKLGADWKYTADGQKAYKEMFDKRMSMYKKDSEEWKEAQRDKWKYEKELADKFKNDNTLPDIEIGEIADADVDVDTSFKGLKEGNDGSRKSEIEIASREMEMKRQLAEAALLDDEARKERELEILDTFNQKKLAILQKYAEMETDPVEKAKLLQEVEDLEIEILTNSNEERARLRQEDVDNAREAEENKRLLISESINAISDILGSVADIYQTNLDAQMRAGELSEKEYKREAKKIKAIQIAQATISTIKGAVDAYMSMAGIPVVGPALGAAAAAVVTAAGIAQITKIKQTDSTGGGNPALGDIPNGSVDVPDSLVRKPFENNVSRQLTGQSEVDELNRDQRVYILESDIQESGERVRVREEESSF